MEIDIISDDTAHIEDVENISGYFAKLGLPVDIRLFNMGELDDIFGDLTFGIDEPIIRLFELATLKLHHANFNNVARLWIKSSRLEVEYCQW